MQRHAAQKPPRKASGLSLIGVMLLLPLAGIVGYIISQQTVGLMKFQRGVKTAAQFGELNDALKLVLNNPESCTINFKDKILATSQTEFQNNSDFSEDTFSIHVPNLAGNKGNLLAKVGTSVG